MNKKYAYLLIGLVALIIGLFKFAPATLISQYIADKTDNTVLLTNAQGTIWQGNAEISIKDEKSQELELGGIDWHIVASRLLLGELSVIFHWNNSDSTTLTLTPTQLSIAKLNINLPANVLSFIVPNLSAAQLGGQLRISTSSFNVTQLNMANLKPNFTGQIQLNWQLASSPLSPINPIGDYQAVLIGTDSLLMFKVNTLSGVLNLEGDGNINPANGVVFSGLASADNSNKQALAPLLHVLGNEVVAGSGNFKINFKH